MPDPTSAERNRRQRHAHEMLGRLLHLAAEDGLAPLEWTIQDVPGASLNGRVVTHDGQRREQFTAWLEALGGLAGRAPDHSSEHTFSSGETRLTAGWEHLPVRAGQRSATASVTISASLWADIEDDEES